MNNKLVNKLIKKWSSPNGLPAKGYELVRQDGGLSPCAQSEAIMLSKGMGTMDLEAFLKGGMSAIDGSNLDKITAKALNISLIHSILLRRFNDLSSQSPAVVLNEPERVLGNNWAKVLEFWHFIDSIPKDQWEELLEELPEKTQSDDYKAKKVALKSLTEDLYVIIPDLYYLPGVTSKPLDSFSVRKISEEELVQKRPDFKIYHSSNQQKPVLVLDPDSERFQKYPGDTPTTDDVAVVGDYSRAYFGWIAPYDYFQSNSPFPPLTAPDLVSKLQVLFACATNEIQVLSDNQGYEDLYFCKLIGYDPTKNYTFKKLSRKFEGYKNSLADKVERLYLIANNYLFSRFSKDPEVNKEATKAMVEGVMELTEADIVNWGETYKRIRETFEVGKGRFFSSLRIRIPKLGANTEADSKFYQLIQELKENYYVWPLSFCDGKNPNSEEGSEWAVSSKNERVRPSFNAPRGSRL